MSATLSRLFKSHPIIGNVIIYGSLYSGAEFAQQTFNKKILIPEGKAPEPYDTSTLMRYGIMGTCVFPHILYHAYKFLDGKFVGGSMPMALTKLAIDSLIITPFNITVFYTGMNFLEGKDDILEEWKAKALPTYLTASVFWIPVMLINFKFMPPHLRVIYVGTGQLIWVSILCWFKRQDFSKKA